MKNLKRYIEEKLIINKNYNLEIKYEYNSGHDEFFSILTDVYKDFRPRKNDDRVGFTLVKTGKAKNRLDKMKHSIWDFIEKENCDKYGKSHYQLPSDKIIKKYNNGSPIIFINHVGFYIYKYFKSESKHVYIAAESGADSGMSAMLIFAENFGSMGASDWHYSTIYEFSDDLFIDILKYVINENRNPEASDLNELKQLIDKYETTK